MKQIRSKNRVMKGQQGFTILETCIVIIMLSLVLLPLFNAMTFEKKREAVLANDDAAAKILAALALFVERNGYYPCPINPQALPVDHAPQLQDTGNGVGCTSVNLVDTGTVLIGGLPVYNLRLPSNFLANAEGWKYKYAVTKATTIIAGGGANAPGQITVIDAGNNVITNTAQFTLVDLGPDGRGARSIRNLNLTEGCGGTLDAENCDDLWGPPSNNIFRDMAIQDDKTNLANFYNDKIYYTLIGKDSTFWAVRQDNATSRLDVSNRNVNGNVGIGISNPTAKLHVSGGDITVVQDPVAGGGSVAAGGNIVSSGGNVEAATGEIRAGTRAVAPVFYYTN